MPPGHVALCPVLGAVGTVHPRATQGHSGERGVPQCHTMVETGIQDVLVPKSSHTSLTLLEEMVITLMGAGT